MMNLNQYEINIFKQDGLYYAEQGKYWAWGDTEDNAEYNLINNTFLHNKK